MCGTHQILLSFLRYKLLDLTITTELQRMEDECLGCLGPPLSGLVIGCDEKLLNLSNYLDPEKKTITKKEKGRLFNIT